LFDDNYTKKLDYIVGCFENLLS